MKYRFLVFGLLGLSSLAIAASWSDFDRVFPGTPCSDGWSGCLVNGQIIDAGTVNDTLGLPHPADLRVGFFDLKPLPGFSPFVGLSAYSGRDPLAVVAQPTPQPDVNNTPQPMANNTPQPQPMGNNTPQPQPMGNNTPQPQPMGNNTPQPAPVTPQPQATPQPQPAASAFSGDCSDLVSLEAPAMMGKLGEDNRSCLEGSLSSASAQTQRNKISRVLIADAEARGDRGDWEVLMKRHLEDIDRSDPNLCFKYAIHLYSGGAGRAHGVIRWSDYALENKSQWSGPTYTKNVYSLLKLRAQAANKLWQSAESAFVEDRSDENEANSTRYRGMTKDYAREWLDYARASGEDSRNPLSLCVSAAGSREFCEG